MTFELLALAICCFACQIKPEDDNETSLSQEFLNRIGIVLTGLRAIGKYMGVSAMTILRWHERYRGRTEAWLCFPLIFTPTGKGWGWTYKAHTGLIAEWMQRWSDIDSKERQARAKRRKVLQMGVTEEGAGDRSIEGRDETAIHEGGLALPEKEPCPCGVPSRCLVHDERFEAEKEPQVKAELRPESSAAQLPGPPVNLNAPHRRTGIQRIEGCVCGSGLTCEAHGEPL